MSAQSGQPGLFLDRDGVLNENRTDHVKRWAEFSFLPRSLRALQLLRQCPVPVVVITNQAIVNRGMVSSSDVDQIHSRMVETVRLQGGRIDRVYYCPHRIDEDCSCRKPEPGLLLKAAAEFNIDLSRSVFVGDWVTDILAGARVSCRTILVRSGRGRDAEQLLSDGEFPPVDAIADDLLQALPAIFELLPVTALPDRRVEPRFHDSPAAGRLVPWPAALETSPLFPSGDSRQHD